MTGTMNNPGTVIIEVSDLSQMMFVAQVDEADIGKLKTGQKAAVSVQAYPDQEFQGVVDTIALSHDMSRESGSKYFKTEILLEAGGSKLHSGLTAHADIETYKHVDVLKVPSQAVMACKVDVLPMEIRKDNAYVDMDKTYAAVVYRYVDGKTVVTPVKIGPNDMRDTIVVGGISKDDKIVVGPYKVLGNISHDMKIKDEEEDKTDDEEDEDPDTAKKK